MKNKILFLLIITILSFSCQEKSKITEIKKKDIIEENRNEIEETWQEGFGLIHVIDLDTISGKPFRYYLESKNLDSTALKFYLGVYSPTDEPETSRLLSLVETKNDTLRPLYRWILEKTIQIQDGALAEYTGVPARKYAEKYPKEFFEYIDNDKTGNKYYNWCNSISYSGFYNYENYENPNEIREQTIKIMTQNCNKCDAYYRMKIEKFANDCFPNNWK